MKNIWVLAQAGEDQLVSEPINNSDETVTNTVQQADPDQPGQQQREPGGIMSFLPLILIFVIIYFILFRGPQKKQKQHQAMVKGIEKNDRIRTIGGIYGTVVEVKDDEIVLKIDEANNTKIKVSKSAIGVNLSQQKS